MCSLHNCLKCLKNLFLPVICIPSPSPHYPSPLPFPLITSSINVTVLWHSYSFRPNFFIEKDYICIKFSAVLMWSKKLKVKIRVCGVRFLIFDILLCFKKIPNLINNWFWTSIIFKNSIKTVFKKKCNIFNLKQCISFSKNRIWWDY